MCDAPILSPTTSAFLRRRFFDALCGAPGVAAFGLRRREMVDSSRESGERFDFGFASVTSPACGVRGRAKRLGLRSLACFGSFGSFGSLAFFGASVRDSRRGGRANPSSRPP